MKIIEYIDNDIDRIKTDVRIGLIPCGILRHYQIYRCYLSYRNVGFDSYGAISKTSLDMNVSDQWVYSIIKRMEKEI